MTSTFTNTSSRGDIHSVQIDVVDFEDNGVFVFKIRYSDDLIYPLFTFERLGAVTRDLREYWSVPKNWIMT